MSDAVWLAIIGVFAMAVKEYFDRMRARDAASKVEAVRLKAADAAAEVQEVKATAAAASSLTDSKLDVIHTIVNQQRTDMMRELEQLKQDRAEVAAHVKDLKTQLSESKQREAKDTQAGGAK